MLDTLIEELLETSDSDLDARVRSLELQRRRIDAEMAMTVGEIDRRKSHLDDGHRTIKAYLRATCNWSDAEAARVDRLSMAVSDLPGLAEVLHDGHIGAPQANELAVANGNRRIREQLQACAPLLLDQAERLSFREFRTCIKRFALLADPDGAHHDLDASIANRRAHVTNLDGSLHLDGSGGEPLVNVELEAIFRHFCDIEYQTDAAARTAEFGTDANEHPLPRTAAQRSYDAIVAIMRGALANDATGRGPKRADVRIDILIDHRTWARLLASAGLAPDSNLSGEAIDPFTGLASPGDLLDDLMEDPDTIATRRCETADGQIVDPHTVLRAALAGHLRRVVLGADHVPINLGRTSRVFVRGAREAALLLAVQCDHPGCGHRDEWCQVDHSIEWGGGGPTDQDNAAPKCGHHNRLKHRKRWRTKRDAHGRTHTVRPDGTIMLPVGARTPTFLDEPVVEPPAANAGQDDLTGDLSDGSTEDTATTNAVLPPDVSQPLDDWVERSTDDGERRCRALRATAIRHAISHGDEVDVANLDLRSPTPRVPG